MLYEKVMEIAKKDPCAAKRMLKQELELIFYDDVLREIYAITKFLCWMKEPEADEDP